ncbi:MAG: pyridoxal phosphate-dependent aminotransferase [Planctomycetes bacterium]|jgi:aspartate aminotransferase|nr:pyridoxal phosphate-dependent aminotransferase [Planctomycetota bacterium]
MKISKRARDIKPPATLAITAKAKQMVAQGIDVVSFSAGEPDFDVPEPAASAAAAAVREKKNRYTPVAGIPELRKAIAAKLDRDNGLAYAPEQVVVTVGAKQAIFNALLALLEEGDEVLVPQPYWVSYPEMTAFAGGTYRFVDCPAAAGYRLSPKALEAAVGPRSRVLILNSPNNPTGAVWPAEDLKRVAEIAEKKDLFVISDEIYEKLVFGGAKHVSIATLTPGMKDRTLVVNGFSKAWAMPGWRLGYGAGPKPLIDAMAGIQGHATSNAPSIVQYAALAALNSDGAPVEAMRKEFEKRRDFVCRRFQEMKGVKPSAPQGAFYVLFDVSGLLPGTVEGREVKTAAEFSTALLEVGKVATVPGEEFGAPGRIRMSFAASMADLEKGLKRIEEFCAKVRRA